MPANERAGLSERLTHRRPPGTVLLATCHRVELYGEANRLADVEPMDGLERRAGVDVARHMVRVAVGRDSAIVAEDQILHQLRSAAIVARDRGPVPPELDRLLDVALRAGRRARSWFPAKRPSLADLAISLAVGDADLTGSSALVVGTGEMGRAAIPYLIARGANVAVASRTPETAELLATRSGIDVVPFDPGPEIIAEQSGIVIALGGLWPLGPDTRGALAAGRAWVVDVSQPPAIDSALAASIAERLTSIDDVAGPLPPDASGRLLARLDALINDTVLEYEEWSAASTRRQAAQALESRAIAVRADELKRLWQRIPELNEDQRAEVARAVDHLTARLLREPLEQLGRDADGRYARAARELFRL